MFDGNLPSPKLPNTATKNVHLQHIFGKKCLYLQHVINYNYGNKRHMTTYAAVKM